MIQWQTIDSIEKLHSIDEASFGRPQLIFKHSTRCSISSMALARLDKQDEILGLDYHLLDLLKYRNISAAIADRYQVQHESPQVLLIKNGACVYDESHTGITPAEVAEQFALIS